MRLWMVSCVLAAAASALTASPASAFCGFYIAGADAELVNKATMVVMMRDGSRTVLSMQNNYEGPPEAFAMVVPVPVILQEENVKVLEQEVFTRVDRLAAPRLVEYWEQDPCYVPPPVERMALPMASAAMAEEAPSEGGADLGVTIEAQFAVGEYEVVILSAQEAAGLDTWLRQNEYSIPDGAEPVLRPYVEAGMKFFVAKVDVSKVRFNDGRAELSPLRFHYDSEQFSLPVRLGLLNSSGTQDLIVHVLALNQRYELANYGNVTIPTNIDVTNDVRNRFGEFYAALFDETMARNPRAIVTEYAWQATNCDPCPGPVLSQTDLMTLGADALPSLENADHYERMSQMNSFVLTRLHTRYDRDALNEDLVFRAAPPIVGGREVRGENGLETGSSSASINNFQGRYAIRHEWTGPIECDNPIRGRWGGPPSGDAPGTRPATDLAYAPRGSLELPRAVKQDVPEIGLQAVAAVVADVHPVPAPPPREEEPTGGGCAGCSASAPQAGALWALLLLVWSRRRR
ncbi:MAG: DUF2330 domain-containing protein [Myxococcota bacterium]